MPFDPVSNSNRAREALAMVIAQRAHTFADGDQLLVAVFNDPLNDGAANRILLFQQFFIDAVGIAPEIAGVVNMCLKVFFNVGEVDEEMRGRIRDLIRSPDFLEVCEDLRVSQVQFGYTFTRVPS